MQQTYFANGMTIVPVEGLTPAILFGGIEIDQTNYNSSVKEGQKEIIKRLKKYVPEFIDDSVYPGERQIPNIFSETSYDMHFLNGQVKGSIAFRNDLGEYLSGHGAKIEKESLELLKGRNGMIIRADYHWKGNEGKGLKLGRCCVDSPSLSFSSDDYSRAFERTLNALGQGIPLTKEVVSGVSPLFYPFSYVDGNDYIDARLKDASLEGLKAADKPVGEFMAWMQEKAVPINTLGELVRLAVRQYLEAQYYTKKAEAGRVEAALPQIVNVQGDRYLGLAQEAFAKLQPPKNNRMEYLVD